MQVLEQWGVSLAVLGMVAATLVLAAIVRQQQAHQARVRAGTRRHEQVIQTIGSALADLSGVVPLSRELRIALRAESLARLQRIRSLLRRYPDIRERLEAAEAAVKAEGPPVTDGVGPIDDEQRFRRILAACDGLTELIRHGSLVQPLPADVRRVFLRELGERRAEAAARFHMTESSRCEVNGTSNRARAHLTTLLHILRNRGPSTDFVRELYVQAETALSDLSNRQLGDSVAGAGGPRDSGQRAPT
jgi:hypothetical protein